jgi:hypothetical protein
VRLYVTIGVNPWGWGRDPRDFEVGVRGGGWGSWRGLGVVEGVVSGILYSKGEGREPRTPQFSNQIDATARYRNRSAAGAAIDEIIYFIILCGDTE